MEIIGYKGFELGFVCNETGFEYMCSIKNEIHPEKLNPNNGFVFYKSIDDLIKRSSMCLIFTKIEVLGEVIDSPLNQYSHFTNSFEIKEIITLKDILDAWLKNRSIDTLKFIMESKELTEDMLKEMVEEVKKLSPAEFGVILSSNLITSGILKTMLEENIELYKNDTTIFKNIITCKKLTPEILEILLKNNTKWLEDEECIELIINSEHSKPNILNIIIAQSSTQKVLCRIIHFCLYKPEIFKEIILQIDEKKLHELFPLILDFMLYDQKDIDSVSKELIILKTLLERVNDCRIMKYILVLEKALLEAQIKQKPDEEEKYKKQYLTNLRQYFSDNRIYIKIEVAKALVGSRLLDCQTVVDELVSHEPEGNQTLIKNIAKAFLKPKDKSVE